MPVHRITVDDLLAAPADGSTAPWRRTEDGAPLDGIIDARSESEYALDHLPGAVNWPSLDDEQRAQVGTEYKQVSAFEARKRGAVLVARNIARHLERHIADKPRHWKPLVYCWRGGQRSGALALVLGQIGFDVQVLEGGYRAFRRRVRADLETAGEGLALRVLCGTTGSGKSRLLQALAARGGQVVDLEMLACHRGSVLGALPGQGQPSQKQFETRVWASLRSLDPGRPVFIESESRMIGRLRVPEALLLRMRAAPCIRLSLPTAERVEGLMDDYPHFVREPSRLAERLDGLREVRGHAVVDAWQARLAQGAVREVVGELLQDHYDPIYLRSMSRNFVHFAAAPELALPTVAATRTPETVTALTALSARLTTDGGAPRRDDHEPEERG
jgi:tRNA 2-selenouridine synthase